MLAHDGSEVVAPTRPEAVKVKFDRDYSELEELINPLTISIR